MRISKSHTRILAAALLALALAGCGAKDLQPAVQTGGAGRPVRPGGKERSHPGPGDVPMNGGDLQSQSHSRAG